MVEMGDGMSLTPDEDGRAHLDLGRRNAQVAQPYGVASLLLALAAMLAARLVFRSLPGWPFWLGAAVLWVAIYYILIALQPTLPLIVLAILASELGLLLSLPAHEVFLASWQELMPVTQLATRMICAGVVGAFTAWAFSVERYPDLVLAICFLLMFVVAGLGQFITFA